MRSEPYRPPLFSRDPDGREPHPAVVTEATVRSMYGETEVYRLLDKSKVQPASALHRECRLPWIVYVCSGRQLGEWRGFASEDKAERVIAELNSGLRHSIW